MFVHQTVAVGLRQSLCNVTHITKTSKKILDGHGLGFTSPGDMVSEKDEGVGVWNVFQDEGVLKSSEDSVRRGFINSGMPIMNVYR
jgi:hypothetical protein